MTNDSEPRDATTEARRAAERLVETPGGPQALLALKKLFEAVEREHGLNDDEGENATLAQAAVIEGLHGLSAAAGADRVLKRRSVGFALNKPRASDAEVERVLARIEADPDATSGAQRKIVKAMTMRAVVDEGHLPKRITSFTAWLLFLGVSGRGAVPGEVFAPSLVSSVDRNTGPFETLKIKLVDMTGYTAGYEGLPITRRLSGAILRRARAAWCNMRRKSRTPIKDAQSGTIRKWCGSTAGAFKFGEQFNLAYQQGLADRAAGKTGARRLLPP